MKLLIISIVLIVSGLLCHMAGAVFKADSFILFAAGIISWLTGLALLAVYLIKKIFRRPDSKASVNLENTHNLKIRENILEAVKKYKDSANRKGLFTKSLLYERPWYVLCGTEKTGKSALIKASELNPYLVYPESAADKFNLSGDEPAWYFFENAVWIDIPGFYFSEGACEERKAFAAAIADIRKKNPVDAVVLTVDLGKIFRENLKEVTQEASRLRDMLDALIKIWQIEFPVYILFTQTDSIPGFDEYFNPRLGDWRNVPFGAELPAGGNTVKDIRKEFDIIVESLTDFRLSLLKREKDKVRRRLICGFCVHFSELKEKLENFSSELFKPSSYRDRPLLRGFYFTSCRRSETAGHETETVVPDISNTIANHPLNPRSNDRFPLQNSQKPVNKFKTYFITPVVKRISNSVNMPAKATKTGSRKKFYKNAAISAVSVFLTVLISVYLIVSFVKSREFVEAVSGRVEAARKIEGGSVRNAYKKLGIMGDVVSRLREYKKNGVPWIMRAGFYRGDELFEEIKDDYLRLLNSLIAGPSVSFFEYNIKEIVGSLGELPGEDYEKCYNSLKAYLSMSEAVSDNRERIDSLFLSSSIKDAVTNYLMMKKNFSRLPPEVETVLEKNSRAFTGLLISGEMPPVQEKQRLVYDARRRLRNLPDAETVYSAAAGRLKRNVSFLSLGDILGGEDDGLLASDKKISVLYTQDGWNRYVKEELEKTCKNPFQADWVTGSERQNTGNIDSEELYNSMVNAWLSDLKKEWLMFLASVEIREFGGVRRASRMLNRLGGHNSPQKLLLERVCELSDVSVGDNEEYSSREVAGKIKKSKKFGKIVRKTSDLSSLIKGKPGDAAGKAFEPVKKFIISDNLERGFEGYRERLLTLAEKTGEAAEKNDEAVFSIFNGKEDDPLLSLRNLTGNVLDRMPEDIAMSCRKLLTAPVSYTARALSSLVTEQVNNKWQNDVIEPYNERMVGKYPFQLTDENAVFEDVMDFFRPSTGVFWGFYDRVLSPYFEKRSGGWTLSGTGIIPVHFDEELLPVLNRVEKIKKLFFNDDGTLIEYSVNISAPGSNKYNVQLKTPEKKCLLVPGGKTERFTWPFSSEKRSCMCNIIISGDYSEELVNEKEWGFERLLDYAEISHISGSAFSALFQKSVQNMYTVNIKLNFNVSSRNHPLGKKLFANIDLPVNITSE